MDGVFQRQVNISNGPQLALYHSKIQVVEYFFDHIRILCKRNYSHFQRTFRTQKWIILTLLGIYPANNPNHYRITLQQGWQL